MKMIKETRWFQAKGNGEKYKRYFFSANNRPAVVVSRLSVDELMELQKKGFGIARSVLRAKRRNALKTIQLSINNNS